MSDKNVCLIPAKAASTRLPQKNLLKINGKELIYYGIKAAISSNIFEKHIFVSTESKKIKEVAEGFGANVPYLRSHELSIDPAGVVDVALDFFEKLPQYQNFDNLIIVLPTAPMIQMQDLINAFSVYSESGSNCLMSVHETEHNALRSVFIKDEIIAPLFKDFIVKKSQELEQTYHINGAITIVNIKQFLKQKTYFIYPMRGYVIPRERSVDIDTKLDYEWAKFLMKNNEK